MLAKLRDKDVERRVAPALADATALPFGADVFAGAYCRWVLHLISDWAGAVRELCRVVRPGCVVIVEPGGYSGEWRAVWLRFVQELGATAQPVGLDVRGDYLDLDGVFAAAGATLRAVCPTAASVDSSLNRFFDDTATRMYSWTWGVPPDDLLRAIEVVRAWAVQRYGADLDAPFAPDTPHLWRVYDLGD
jgi:SAM-dependent methyltransferase